MSLSKDLKQSIVAEAIHAVSVFEIFFTWHNGMTLCSATNDIMFRDIERVIRDMGVTHLSLTPTVAALISPSNVPRVRFLVTAGEGLTTKVHKDWAGQGLYQGKLFSPTGVDYFFGRLNDTRLRSKRDNKHLHSEAECRIVRRTTQHWQAFQEHFCIRCLRWPRVHNIASGQRGRVLLWR